MARARNIKPGFFKNEELADLPAEVRLLFIGLWTLADREGRMEDRPKRIRAELFPFDGFDVESMLNQLQSSGFVVRYEFGGSRFLQVVNFVKHQDPHYKEKASEIPPPPGAENLIKATQITRETRARILERDGYRCRCCSSEDYLSVDHIVPTSRGGTGEDSNLQVLCLKCNTKKGNKLPGESKRARRSKHDDTSLLTRPDVDSTLNQPSRAGPSLAPLIPDSLIPDSLIPDSLIPDLSAAATTPEALAGARASPAAEVCKALRLAGFPDANPAHPTLLALVEAGVTAGEFLAAAPQATGKRDPFAYLLAVVQGRRVDAAAVSAATPRGVTAPQRVRPLSAAEERVLEACPSIASQDLLRRAAALGRVIPTTAMEVVDVDATAPARRLG